MRIDPKNGDRLEQEITEVTEDEEDHFRSPALRGHEHKFGDVCGEEFPAQARRERRAYPEVDL